MRFEKKKLTLIIVAAVALVLLAGCDFSLAGDVTPPPNYVPPTAPAQTSGAQPTTTQTVFPLVPPDPAQGATIYATNCLPCHGATGMGDGPQGAQLPNPPAAIGSPDLARQSRPVDWYNMVTNGNMQNFMPPFADALSDRQRWDVIAYVYTLSTNQADLAQGKALYDQNCASCHGPSGLGDGPQAANLSTKPVAWAKDQSRLSLLSDNDMSQVINSGKGEMPGFQGKLTQAQSYQVADYVRSLGFSSSSNELASAAASGATPAPNQTEQSQQTAQPGQTTQPGQTQLPGTPAATVATTGTAPTIATINGQVTNGTPGGKVPTGLKVTLQGYQGMTPSLTKEVDVASDGSYAFKDVAVDSQTVYVVSVEVSGITYSSDILHGTDITTGKANLPVKIYDPSTDASGLSVDRLHVFFDFSKQNVVQVINLYIITNPSDHVIVPPATGKPVISFDLPAGATNLQFQDGALGGRYVKTDTGFGDTMGVVPGVGQDQVLFAYDMPYTGKLSLDIKAPLPVSAAIVMVPPGVKLSGGQLSDAGQQDVQGTSFHMYQANSSLNAGQSLAVSLSGLPGSANAATTQNPINYMLIGLGAFGLVLIGAGAWLFFRQRQMKLDLAGAGTDLEPSDGSGTGDFAGTEESSEALLDAIVTLDDLHASGNLPDAAYQERREELKSRLGDALAREKGK